MNVSDYKIRNYRHSDFDNYVDLRHQPRKQAPLERVALWIAEHLKHPHFTPEKDLFLIEADGNLIGFLELMPEPDIKRSILTCWIRPEHRKKGLAGKLLGYAIDRARELGNNALHVNVADDNEIAIGALEKLGFTPVRRYLDIQLDMEKVPWQDIDPSELACRQLMPGEEEKLARIQNRAFAEHWGYNPNTVESIKYDIDRGDNSLENIVVTCEGDDITGYCWVEIMPHRNENDKKQASVFMLGTDPDYRSTGAGKRVLLGGLLYLKNRGIEITHLTVDSDNTVARALYESIGFELRATTLWYEKNIEQT